MRLIGFSRRKLSAETTLKHVFDTIAPIFGAEGFRFASEAEDASPDLLAFDFERGVKILQNENCVGFWKENAVGISIDLQAHTSRWPIYPHSTVQIELINVKGVRSAPALTVNEWLAMAEKLVETLGMELAIVLGSKENAADYWRTPLSVGIGLIGVYWIMCFGEGYSRLITPKPRETYFFDRHEFGKAGFKAFVSAPSFDAYQSESRRLLTLQRSEIGDDLFNRLPVQQRHGGGGAYPIFSFRTVIQVVGALYRQYATNWRKFQAKVVPEYYKE